MLGGRPGPLGTWLGLTLNEGQLQSCRKRKEVEMTYSGLRPAQDPLVSQGHSLGRSRISFFLRLSYY